MMRENVDSFIPLGIPPLIEYKPKPLDQKPGLPPKPM